MSNVAETTNDSTRNIVRDGVQRLDEHVAAALPSHPACVGVHKELGEEQILLRRYQLNGLDMIYPKNTAKR